MTALDDGHEVAVIARSIPTVTSKTGIFVSVSSDLVSVNLGGGVVQLPGWAPPIPGMPVRVESLNGRMRVAGPGAALPTRGTVTATGTGTATIVHAGSAFVFPVLANYTPIPGDKVVIDWINGVIQGKAADLTAPAPDTGGGKVSKFKGLLIQATTSARYDYSYSNWWGNGDPWASNTNDGIWVYGGRLSALEGATITSAEIFLPLITQAGSAFIGIHGYPGIPGGAPSFSFGAALPNRNGWVSLPSGYGAWLATHPDAGLGVSSGAGYNTWRGVPSYPMSGALRFSGTRS